MLPHHVFVIPQRLYLQKIVVFRDLAQLFKALTLHNSSVKFACFTGGTNQKSVPVLVQNAARHPGLLEKVVGMSLANDLVQIFQAHLVAHQDNQVIILLLDDLFVAAAQADVDVFQPLDLLFRQIFQHLAEDLGKGHGVVYRPVMVEGLDLQMVVDGIQLIVAQAWIQVLGHGQRVDVGVVQFDARPFGGDVHEAHIELVGVVGNEHPTLCKFCKHAHRFVRRGGVRHHAVVDAGELHDLWRDGLARVHEGTEGLGDLAVLHHHRADLGEEFGVGVQAGGLGIVHHKAAAHGAGGFTVQHRDHVIHKVGLHAVDDLEIRVAFADGIRRQHCFREALHHTVVGNSDGPMAHAMCGTHDLARVAEAVHAAELGVQVQLHPLLGGVVLPLAAFHLQHVVGVDHIVVLVLIVGAFALQHQGGALFQLLPLAEVLPFPAAELQVDGAGVVGDGNDVALLEVAFYLHCEHVAPDHHTAAVAAQLLQRGQLAGLEVLAVEQLNRLVGQVQAGDLDGRQALLLLKLYSGHLLQNLLLPFLHRGGLAGLGKLHLGQSSGALLNALGQGLRELNLLQNFFAHFNMQPDELVFDVDGGMVQKAVDRIILVPQLADQLLDALRGDDLIGKAVLNLHLKAIEQRAERSAQAVAQIHRQRRTATQMNANLPA